MIFGEVGKFVGDGLNNAGKAIAIGAGNAGKLIKQGIDNTGKFISDNKENIIQGAIVVGGIVALAAMAGGDSSEELTEGQELDLSNALDSARWSFDEEIESAYASGDTISFYLSNGETEFVNFHYDGGTWSAYSFGSEVVSNAVDSILSELN